LPHEWPVLAEMKVVQLEVVCPKFSECVNYPEDYHDAMLVQDRVNFLVLQC
jgi:hypothetical protein